MDKPNCGWPPSPCERPVWMDTHFCAYHNMLLRTILWYEDKRERYMDPPETW